MNLLDSNGKTDTARFGTARALELLAVWVTSMSALGLLSLRLGAFNAPQVWLGAIGATCAYHVLTRRAAVHSDWLPPLWQMILVVGVGLFFRLTPYAYVLGGQDQGLYVNMAMELVRTGGLHPIDQVSAGWADPAFQQIYHAANYTPTIYVPGVYTTPDGLVFQFYHLFPVWLALFESGAGPGAAVYGLVFLSLLSLLFFQCLAQLLTGSVRIGLAAGLLLAINPLHAFFSKFPLTEVPTLAFSSMALVFLAMYWRNADDGGGRRWLLLSAAAFGMVFATRITGFMYMPFVLAVFLVALLFERNPGRRDAFLFWAFAVACLYACSVLYGLKWSAPYAHDIYRQSFAPLLGDRWWTALRIVIALAAAACFAAWGAMQWGLNLAWLRRLTVVGARALPLLAVLFVGIALYKAYRLGFTDAYAKDPWLGTNLRLSHQGWRAFFSASLPAAAVYLSPFILAAFFIASFRRGLSAELRLLLFFAVCFVGHICVLQWYLPYQPYYARYLVSEVVPYVLLFAVCALATAPAAAARRAKSLLALGGAWCLVLSVMQLGKNENEGTLQSLHEIVAVADRGDAVLLDESISNALRAELQTPLVYSFGLNVLRVGAEGLCNTGYLSALDKKYDDLYLLSTGADTPTRFVPVQSIRFLSLAFKHGATPPVSVVPRYDLELRMHRLAAGAAHGDCAISWRNNGVLGTGWSGHEAWGTWTNSRRAEIVLSEAVLSGASPDAVLLLRGRVYARPGAPLQRVRVLREGRVLAEAAVKYPAAHLRLAVPLKPLPPSSGLTLQLEMPDAVSPKQLGESADAREIAFGLESMTIQ